MSDITGWHMPPAKGDTVTVKITDMNNLGCGVGRLGADGESGGKVVFVNGAVTGDTVEAKIIKVTSSYCVARLESVTEPSPYRTEDICGAPLACGGCIYRNITYDHELALKREYVYNAFRKAGLPDITVLPVLTAGKRTNYRNKAMYPVGRNSSGITAGFYASKTHTIIPAYDCAIQNGSFKEIVKFVCSYADEHGISVYNEKTGRGLLRHIYLRTAVATGEIMLCLVINGDFLPGDRDFVRSTCGRFPDITGILLNINKKNTNVVLGGRFVTLFGREYIEDILCGLRFRITPQSFYQVNHDGAELLYSLAKKLAALDGSQTVVDLYCGTGTIGLTMADSAKEVIGVEIVESAVECAGENARLNGIVNASFYCGDSEVPESLLAGVDKKHGNCLDGATVIIDPPRKGITRELADFLARRGAAKVIYVSCGPDTLARDAVYFRENGYTVGAVQPVDMFPGTGHVECVVLMAR